MKVYYLALFGLSLLFLQSCSSFNADYQELKKPGFRTMANPLNLSYRFMPDGISRREAADPTLVVFRDEYFLFASKSGGYWHTSDLVDWNFIGTDEIPTEQYAPTVIQLRDTLFFLASSRNRRENAIYQSADPKSGKWSLVRGSMPFPVWDPAFFEDKDDKLYLYWGCSNTDPIRGIELNPYTFDPVGDSVDLITGKPEIYGWENPGDYNEIDRAPWIEGAWMNEREGKYYLQYAGPGTEFKSYADGVYVGDHPLGPFTLQSHNPFSYKPEGFINGAGHGSTFQDKYNNCWHMGTMTVYVKDWFERRIGLFPTYFDSVGNMVTSTAFGDYPMIIPEWRFEEPSELFPGWMLLSYNKEVKASSSIDSLPAINAVDENIRSYWSADTGEKGEWFMVDLKDLVLINAIQINFYDHNTQIFKRDTGLYHQYILEYSNDGNSWNTMFDESQGEEDTPHDYVQLETPVIGRYVRLVNVKVPDGSFALSGLRVFGSGFGEKPEKVTGFNVERDPSDYKVANASWDPVNNAIGYIIHFGPNVGELYNSYMVYGHSEVTIRSLNAQHDYYFMIRAFNENGIAHCSIIQKVSLPIQTEMGQ